MQHQMELPPFQTFALMDQADNQPASTGTAITWQKNIPTEKNTH
jgi:hypothetical protein